MTLGSPFSVSHSESCSQLLGCGAQQRLKNQTQEGRAILWACSVCILSCSQQNLVAKKVEVDWDHIPVSHWQGLSELCLVRLSKAQGRDGLQLLLLLPNQCLFSPFGHWVRIWCQSQLLVANYFHSSFLLEHLCALLAASLDEAG